MESKIDLLISDESIRIGFLNQPIPVHLFSKLSFNPNFGVTISQEESLYVDDAQELSSPDLYFQNLFILIELSVERVSVNKDCVDALSIQYSSKQKDD